MSRRSPWQGPAFVPSAGLCPPCREGNPRGTEPSAARGPRESGRNLQGDPVEKQGPAQAPEAPLRHWRQEGGLSPHSAPGSASCLLSTQRRESAGARGRPPKRGWCKGRSLGSPQPRTVEEAWVPLELSRPPGQGPAASPDLRLFPVAHFGRVSLAHWHVDHFELKARETQKILEKL